MLLKDLKNNSVIKFGSMAIMSAILLMPELVQANSTSGNPLKTTAESFKDVFETFGPVIQIFFFIAGLVIFGLAGFDLWKRSQPQGQKPEMSGVVYKLLGGSFCVGLGALAGWAKTSLFGNQEQIKYDQKITFQ